MKPASGLSFPLTDYEFIKQEPMANRAQHDRVHQRDRGWHATGFTPAQICRSKALGLQVYSTFGGCLGEAHRSWFSALDLTAASHGPTRLDFSQK